MFWSEVLLGQYVDRHTLSTMVALGDQIRSVCDSFIPLLFLWCYMYRIQAIITLSALNSDRLSSLNATIRLSLNAGFHSMKITAQQRIYHDTQVNQCMLLHEWKYPLRGFAAFTASVFVLNTCSWGHSCTSDSDSWVVILHFPWGNLPTPSDPKVTWFPALLAVFSICSAVLKLPQSWKSCRIWSILCFKITLV